MKLKKDYLIAIPIILVIVNMILIATGHMLPLDTWVYNHIGHHEILTKILLFITNFGSTKYIVAICVLFLIFYKPKKKLVNLYGVTIVSTIINNIIKFIFRRPRPELMGSLVPVFESTFSFPSGHAMASTTFYGYLIYMLYKSEVKKPLKITGIALLSLLIFMVCFSRVYIYVHYFSDVITGFMCSLVVLFFYIKVTKKITFFNTEK